MDAGIVNDLTELARDLDKVSRLPREVIVSLYTQAAGLEAALRARLLAELTPSGPPAGAPFEPEEWLSAKQVASRFGLDAAWLARHRRELRTRQIESRVSRKRAVYHRRRLERFVESRTRPG